MAPYFEIFQKIEIMRMVSLLPGWCEVERPLNSRIENYGARGMGDDPYPEIEDVRSSRREDCEAMRMASCILEDYIQTNLRRIKLGWRKTKPNQKQGIRRNIYVVLRLTQAFRS